MQKTAYEMRISDWSSDVCSSDLLKPCPCCLDLALDLCRLAALDDRDGLAAPDRLAEVARQRDHPSRDGGRDDLRPLRSEEHTSELQSLMRISYAVFCLKKTTKHSASIDKTRHCSNQPHRHNVS